MAHSVPHAPVRDVESTPLGIKTLSDLSLQKLKHGYWLGEPKPVPVWRPSSGHWAMTIDYRPQALHQTLYRTPLVAAVRACPYEVGEGHVVVVLGA